MGKIYDRIDDALASWMLLSRSGSSRPRRWLSTVT